MVLIFTDLDGTLLNQDDYRYDLALPTLRKLQSAQIPVIPVTSKTKAEVAYLCQEIGLNDPFITENGSGIFLSENEHRFDLPTLKVDDYYCQMLGFNYEQARTILPQMSASLGLNLVGFGDLSTEEVCQLTGLSIVEAKLAKQRDFTEPFVTPKNIPPSILLQTASVYSCHIVVGDRFSHLISKNAGKGNAVTWLLNNYRDDNDKTITIGLGNSPNDLSLLENVDIPIIIPGIKGVHPQLQDRGWRVAPVSGCQGWSIVVEAVMAELQSMS